MQHIKLLTGLLLLFSVSLSKAQSTTVDYTANDIFKGFMGWDVRFGGETHTIDTKNTNTIINTVTGTQKSVYKNSRLTAELLAVDWASGFKIANRIKLGFVLGFHGGFIYQKESLKTTSSGFVASGDFPGDFGGNQGNLGGSFTLNLEGKAGLSLAYQINKPKNINISGGYSLRYWPKTALGFYTLPDFIGGFVDVNMTYKNWFLYTTFRSKSFVVNTGIGEVKTSYISIMPTYNIGRGLTCGVRFEGAAAKYNTTYTIQSTRTEQQLKANSFNIGLYFGFLL